MTRPFFIIIGLMLALLGANPLPSKTVQALAWVNKTPITAEQVEAALQQLIRNNTNESATNKNLVLNMLIDEELLLQRADNLGLTSSDPNNRKTIIRAVISHITEQQAAIDEQQLRQFHADNRAVFEQPPRLQLRVLRFASQQHALQARQAFLNGADINTIKSLPLINKLPNAVLPAHVIRRYLGPSLTQQALRLKQNEISMPITTDKANNGVNDVYLIHAITVQAAQQSSFESVQQEVETQFLRKQRDTALQRYIADLRRKASVEYNARLIRSSI